MNKGIRWIGEHRYTRRSPGLPGVREGISLTVARGIGAREFLLALGAHAEDLDRGVLFKDREKPRTATSDSFAMYGTRGEWVYVLEETQDATWYAKSLDLQKSRTLLGAEIVCVTRREDDPPSYVSHVTPEGHASYVETGDFTGHSAFDDSLRAAGAIYPSSLRDSPEEVVETYWEAHLDDLLPRVFTAVGDHCGLEIGRSEVEAGDLPLVVFPSTF
ncbi:hypothetical protein ACIQFP_12305 [Nocardiopsis alba]|uniref:hypothetical protein n=1 Tax=Nocardiopsis alba TaxID=53437 RepID=UPI0038140C88